MCAPARVKGRGKSNIPHSAQSDLPQERRRWPLGGARLMLVTDLYKPTQETGSGPKPIETGSEVYGEGLIEGPKCGTSSEKKKDGSKGSKIVILIILNTHFTCSQMKYQPFVTCAII